MEALCETCRQLQLNLISHGVEQEHHPLNHLDWRVLELLRHQVKNNHKTNISEDEFPSFLRWATFPGGYLKLVFFFLDAQKNKFIR